MEENSNNNIIVKGLAIILIAILALNVYLTETTKKDLGQLATTVAQLSAQLDSLGAIDGTAPAPAGVSKKDFTTLSKSVSSLESKVTALQGTVESLSRSKIQSGSSSRVSDSSSSKQTSSTSNSTSTSVTASSKGRVSVAAKVKVEDRYVRGATYLPKITYGPTGVVIVRITIDHGGFVTSARVKSESTISDEDILDACKDAALRTSFNVNLDVPEKHPATITYTFTVK